MGHFHGIFNNMYLILQRGIGHESDIGKEEKLFNTGDIKNTDMGQSASCAQAHFLVQNTL